MYDAPNAVEELKHPTAEKVEAIKDALKYFGGYLIGSLFIEYHMD